MDRKMFNYKLKEKDIELLKMADKASNLDKLMTNIRYYTKEDTDKRDKFDVLNSKVRVYTMEDLLYKYRAYAPEYFEKDNSFSFGKAVPVEVFMLFRYDSARFNFSELIVKGEDPDAGYRSCSVMK